MYQFITHTWNPLAGKCPHSCNYCSTNKFYYSVLKDKYSGPIRIVEKELKTNLGENNFIFVAAQNDLFANDVPSKYIERILKYCKKFDKNKYLFQSKNPGRILEFIDRLPNDSVICTTIETNRYNNPYICYAPSPFARAIDMNKINFPKYVTIEPIMQFDLKEMVDLIKICSPIQTNLGADSGGNNLIEPTKEEVFKLVEELKKFTKVELKKNLNRIIK